MNDDFELTTAQYLVGNLNPEERQFFEEKLAHLPRVRKVIEEWDLSLSELLLLRVANEGSIRVPKQLWVRILEEINPLPLREPSSLFAWQGLRSFISVWQRWSFGFASGVTAALAIAAFSGALDLTRPFTSHQVDLVLAGKLTVNARFLNTPWQAVQIDTGAIEEEPDASLELWLIRAGKQPISMGVLSEGTTFLWLESSFDHPEEAALAISKEPLGGSPEVLPTGPVLALAPFTPR